MSKQIEALKMVNDILDDELWFPNKYPDEAIPVCFIDALKACKEALAEAEKQEPVGVVYSMQDGYVGQMVVKGIPHGTKLYTHPTTWQSLSDDELSNLYSDTTGFSMIDGHGSDIALMDFARVIEQVLKEKNNGS